MHYQNNLESTCQPCISILNHVSQGREASSSHPKDVTDHFSFEVKEAIMLTKDRIPSKEVPSQMEPTPDTCPNQHIDEGKPQGLFDTSALTNTPKPGGLTKGTSDYQKDSHILYDMFV